MAQAQDLFKHESSGVESPARRAVAITPSDTEDLTFVSRGLYVGSGGDLVCILIDDTEEITLVGVVAGTVLPICVKRVLTSSTASSLVALY